MQYLPYALLLLTLILEGQGAALIESSGLVAAHLHDFLTRLYPTFGNGRVLIPTPGFVRRWFETGRQGPTTRPYGTAFIPRTGNEQAGRGRGASRGFSSGIGGISNLWGNRGAGRRLGGD